MTTAQSPDLRNLRLLLSEALEWANHCAGEGLGYADPAKRDPDEFLMAYSDATGDVDWDTFHQTIPDTLLTQLEALQKERDEARALLAKIYFWINDHVEVPTNGAARRMMDINELIGIDALEAVRISARATLKEHVEEVRNV